MINWILQRLSGTVYVRVRKDQFLLRHIEKGKDLEIYSKYPFTTSRLLIGDFSRAEKTLKDGIFKLFNNPIVQPKPKILMHPLDMVKGGLSQVEARVLREVAFGAGASKTQLWVGSVLTDDEVLREISKSDDSYSNTFQTTAGSGG